ncbi:hypothetical protein Ga0609869_000772 [Rhodovulum iodosum]|uniref:VPLPA-CTERM sorting domain-containing protein n=1 Tax=Rhodovulum iodosum TaxID=68291 RepID=A0ABV3XQD0_9RHOB|nr:VPLPA-CTERM sorting domain-containing protein [Rhodovulum robiginosum]RSK31306.1 hypothetical protein EJA01_14240 [Rhodovulum robiginosum]
MTRIFNLALAGISVAAISAGAAQATVWTIEDFNSTVRYDDTYTGEPSGVFDWIVNGIDVMYEENFWIRVGDTGPEEALTSLELVGIQVSDTNAFVDDRPDVLSARYAKAGLFTADVRYSLQGSPGGCCSDLAEQLTISNTSERTLRLSVFEYTDFDIGDIIDDVAYLEDEDTFVQLGNGFRTEVITGPNPDAWEIDYYSNIRDMLTDGDADNLSNTTSPLGSGDLTWAAQWDFVVPEGGSVTISKDKLVISTIPVPASFGLLAAAVLGFGAFRRSRKS